MQVRGILLAFSLLSTGLSSVLRLPVRLAADDRGQETQPLINRHVMASRPAPFPAVRRHGGARSPARQPARVTAFLHAPTLPCPALWPA